MNFGRFGRRAVLLLSLACGLAGAQPTARIITGFPPGGAVDVLSRIYADELSRELGHSVTVVQANEQPEVVLLAITDRRDRAIVAATAAGLPRQVIAFLAGYAFGTVIGVVASVAGVATSYYQDTPSGGTIVLFAIGFFVIVATVSGLRERRRERVHRPA